MDRIANWKSLMEIHSSNISKLEADYGDKKKGQIYNARKESILNNALDIANKIKNFGTDKIRVVSISSKPLGVEQNIYHHTIFLHSSITEEEIKSYYALFNYKVLEVNFKKDLLLGFPRLERK